MLKVSSLVSSQVTSLNLENKKIRELSEIIGELKTFSNLQNLSLRGNQISRLDREIGVLKKLRLLDISQNPVETVQDVLEGLFALPFLRELKIDLVNEGEEGFLIEALPKLQVLNNKNIGGKQSRPTTSSQNRSIQSGKKQKNRNYEGVGPNHDDPSPFRQEFSITNEELEDMASVFDCVKLLVVEGDPSRKNEMGSMLEEHIKRIMVDLGLTINKSMHESVKTTHNLKAKFALYELIFVQLIEYTRETAPRISEILADLHDTHSNILNSLIDVIFDLEPKSNKLYTAYRENNLKAFKEAGSAIESAEKLFEENQRIIQSWEQDQKKWEVERKSFEQEIKHLEKENKRYLDMILKSSKEKASEATKSMKNGYKGSEIEPVQNQTESRITDNVRGSQKVSPSSCRMLTLNQLKEVINEIYASKLKCDQKYIESKLARETMEQHMYTYLNTKYGLKTLIIEWATAIINGIKKYNSKDNDVAVFGKILRNECDEEFRFVQSQVKTTIRELLKMLVKGKYPYKNKLEVKELLKGKTEGFLGEEEAQEIVRYMYSKEDSEVILNMLQPLFITGIEKIKDRRLTREEKKELSKDKTKVRVQFSAFEKLILDFQLKSHERFLDNFNALFRREDDDQNGIISEEEFKQVVRIIDPRGEFGLVVEDMLELLDPFSNNVITYSSCVTLFSSKLVDFNGKKLSVLHKLSLQALIESESNKSKKMEQENKPFANLHYTPSKYSSRPLDLTEERMIRKKASSRVLLDSTNEKETIEDYAGFEKFTGDGFEIVSRELSFGEFRVNPLLCGTFLAKRDLQGGGGESLIEEDNTTKKIKPINIRS